MAKQNIGLAGFSALAVSLLIYSLARSNKGVASRAILAFLAGSVIGALPYMIWLLANGVSLSMFYEQAIVGSATAKGVSVASAGDSTIARAVKSMFTKTVVALTVLTTFSGYLEWRTLTTSNNTCRLSAFRSMSIVLAAVALIYVSGIYIAIADIIADFSLFINSYEMWLSAAVLIVMFILLLFRRRHEGAKKEEIGIIFAVGCGVATAVITVALIEADPEIISGLISNKNYDTYSGRLMKAAFHLLMGIFLGDLCIRLFGKDEILPLQTYYLVAVSLATVFVSLVGSGSGSFAPSGSVFSFSSCLLLLDITLQRFAGINEHSSEPGRPIGIVRVLPIISIAFCGFLCVLLSFETMLLKLHCPYSFYGWRAKQITDATNYSVDIPGYECMRVSERDKTTIEQITWLIGRNTNPDDTVNVFAQGKLYNVNTNRLNHDTFGLVHFFDICPDNVAIEDAKALAANPPTIVVWKDYGEETWSLYENNHRGGGRLGQRDIQEWFDSVKETDYQCIGSVYNEKVYLLKSAGEPQYTFFAEQADVTSNIEDVQDNVHVVDVLALIRDESVSQYRLTAGVAAVVLLLSVITFLADIGFGADIYTIVLTMTLLGLVERLSPIFACIFAIPLVCIVYSNTFKEGWGNRIAFVLLLELVVVSLFQWSSVGGLVVIILEILLSVLYCVLVVMGLIRFVRLVSARGSLKADGPKE
jgi:hypothetical protein